MQKKRFSPRYKRMVSLASLLPKISKTIVSKMGLIHGKLLLNWDDIVGTEWGLKIRPIKLTRSGVLHVGVRPAHTLEAQYASKTLISRLNKYLGGAPIKNLHYVQQHFLRSSDIEVPPTHSSATSQKEPAITERVILEGAPEELSLALTRLKAALQNNLEKNSTSE
ncbi:MAG: DUF721 domain-containing protein [bacterium]|nr:DUF721 domain-containing protein [bacterium]